MLWQSESLPMRGGGYGFVHVTLLELKDVFEMG
jgi:hypothetical protein